MTITENELRKRQKKIQSGKLLPQLYITLISNKVEK